MSIRQSVVTLCRILDKLIAGKVHDKKQLDEEDWVSNIPDQVVIEEDSGYQGLQLMLRGTKIPPYSPAPSPTRGEGEQR